MNIAHKLAAGCGLAIAGLTAQAVPLYDDTYNLTDAGATRGIYLFHSITANGTSDHTFNLRSGSVFDVGGDADLTTANLSGSAYSSGLAGGLSFNVDMTYRCTSTLSDGPGNNVNVDNGMCGLGAQPVGSTHPEGETWDFWDYTVPGTYKLIGFDSLDGLELTISQKPSDLSKPFRFGIGADWDNDPLVGGSGWFDITNISITAAAEARGVRFAPSAANSRGDFNVSVPEPGSLALLALGLLGMTRVRKRV